MRICLSVLFIGKSRKKILDESINVESKCLKLLLNRTNEVVQENDDGATQGVGKCKLSFCHVAPSCVVGRTFKTQRLKICFRRQKHRP